MRIILSLMLLISSMPVCAKGIWWFPFQWVMIPDQYVQTLIDQYGRDDVCAECNVQNLAIIDDIEFQNGIYRYGGMGPHFKHKIFIYYNKRIFVFPDYQEEITDNVFKSFKICTDSLKISGKDSLLYSQTLNKVFLDKFPFRKTKKERIPNKELTSSVLAKEWMLQIQRRKINGKYEWDRMSDFYIAKITEGENTYSIHFARENGLNTVSSNMMDTINYFSVNNLKIKKVFMYNQKIYLILYKKIGDNVTEEYLVSQKNL